MMFNTRNASKFLWIGLGLLLFAAILMPASWTSFGKGITPPLDVFSVEIAQLDYVLDNEEALPAHDEQTLKNQVIYVQARRLLRTGPMSSDESRLATKILHEWQPQIVSQSHDGSRASMRQARNDVLAEKFPRLNKAMIAEELDQVDAQFQEAHNKNAHNTVGL